MDVDLRLATALSNNREHRVSLKVVRAGEKSGHWFWRSAHYLVFREQEDGAKVKILDGKFEDHHQALKAARKLLRQN